MSVRKTMVKLELGLLLRDRSALVVMAVFALLVAWASWMGGARVEQRRGVDAEVAERAQARLAEAAKNGVSAEVAGGSAVRPVAVLSPRPLGGVVSREAGPTRVEATAAPMLEAQAKDALDAEAQAAGPLDLLFVLIQLLPLVVIALGYDILSGDRERGTLTLLLAQPLRLRDLVAAKAVARLAALALVAGIAAITALISGAVSLGDGGLADAGWLALLVVLWMAFWFSAALAVNAWGSSSSGNALALTTLWLVLVVIGPGLLRASVEAAYPPPSRVALATAARDAAAASEEALEAIEGDHRAGKEMARPGMDGGKAAAERELRARLAPLKQGFEQALINQQGQIDALRVLSPAITTSEAIVALAGEDLTRRAAWMDAVEGWHGQLRAYFSAARAAKTKPDLSAMPQFPAYTAPADALSTRLVVDAAVLLGWIVLALLIAARGLRRETGRLT